MNSNKYPYAVSDKYSNKASFTCYDIKTTDHRDSHKIETTPVSTSEMSNGIKFHLFKELSPFNLKTERTPVDRPYAVYSITRKIPECRVPNE